MSESPFVRSADCSWSLAGVGAGVGADAGPTAGLLLTSVGGPDADRPATLCWLGTMAAPPNMADARLFTVLCR